MSEQKDDLELIEQAVRRLRAKGVDEEVLVDLLAKIMAETLPEPPPNLTLDQERARFKAQVKGSKQLERERFAREIVDEVERWNAQRDDAASDDSTVP